MIEKIISLREENQWNDNRAGNDGRQATKLQAIGQMPIPSELSREKLPRHGHSQTT